MEEAPDYKAMNAGDFLQAVGMDAEKWTEAYLQIWPSGNNDHATMIGWFANAIMAGYDRGDAMTPVSQWMMANGYATGHGETLADLLFELAHHDLGRPVAYRVKDFADGWILCHTLEHAQREAEGAGNLIQPLYI